MIPAVAITFSNWLDVFPTSVVLQGERPNRKEVSMMFESKKRGPEVVTDGIVNPELYFCREKTPVRVLFVLKEANDPNGGGWDLCEFLRDGGRWQTWNNVTRWAMALGAMARGEIKEDVPIDADKRKEVLSHVAAVNLKKVPGGSKSCKDEILCAAKENASLIREQVNECRCDVVVCCGVGVAEGLGEVFANDELLWRESRGRRLGKCGEAEVLDFCHPAARRCKAQMSYEITQMRDAAEQEVWL